MQPCILCLNYVEDVRQLDECVSLNLDGFEVIRKLFSFSEVKKKLKIEKKKFNQNVLENLQSDGSERDLSNLLVQLQ